MAARYTWMFRTAAVLFLFFGGVWLWRFGFTDYHPEQRPYGLAAGALSLLVGVFLLRGHRLAIGVSAVATAVVGISAAVFAPNCARARDPVSRGAGHRLLSVCGVCRAGAQRSAGIRETSENGEPAVRARQLSCQICCASSVFSWSTSSGIMLSP